MQARRKRNPLLCRDGDASPSDPKFDAVVDKIAAREAQFIKGLREYTPMVETYIQNMRPDKDLGQVPISDEYFLEQDPVRAGSE